MSKRVTYKFDEVIYDDTKRGTKIKKENYLKEGKHPIIDQGKELIAGYYDIDDGLYTDTPAIIFGDHTRIIKYIDSPFFLGADGVKILKTKYNNIDYKYLYYFFLKNEVPDTGYNRHFKWLKEIDIFIPPLDVQKKIAKTLDTVSELFAMRKQQLTELDNLIKSVFYDMFGDPIKNTKGWERKELSNCCYVNPKKSEINCFTDSLEVSFVSMASVSEKGDINTNEIKLYKEVKAGFTYFYENDVLFAKITPCMENGKGAIARGLKNNIGFGSTEFHVLRPKNGISNSEWLYHLTALPVFRDSAEKNMTGSAGQKRVPVSFFDKFFVPLPPISLQDEFATIVTKIEAQKSLVKKSIEETQLLFDSLMSQYFDE